MKYTILLIVVILFVLSGGYFVLTKEHNTSVPKETSQVGEVIGVLLDQLAFDGPALVTIEDVDGEVSTVALPSMGLSLCAARGNIADVGSVLVGDIVRVSGSLDEAGNIVPCEKEEHYFTLLRTVENTVLGYRFEYREGPQGYVVLEDAGSTDPDYVGGSILFNKEEYNLFQESTEAREGPTAIHLRVYKNDENLHAPVWALRKPLESNILLALNEPTETVVGGANATMYIADGLYLITTYVVASGEYVYVLMGSYLGIEDVIYSDFQDFVSSFTFIPTTKTP